MNNAILSIKKVTKNFGALTALKDIEVNVRRGDIHGVIGPNGAGKTTFINIVSGCLPVSGGECCFEGSVISNSESHTIANMALTRTFQQGHIFPKMTCLQNVMTGRHRSMKAGFLKTMLRPPFIKSSEEEETKKRCLEYLDFVGLKDSANRWASDLNWVEVQLLQIARALASEPKLLLLDEPTAGMGQAESRIVGEIIKFMREEGITIILVSHDMKLVMDIADRLTVLNFGEKIFEGTPEEAQTNPEVLEAYLGE
ncbi:MAG: ABC transporter ATP-binding protein [Spirochaetes bacterium]|nr:ABC transporter ATP-binding protein [Spirochaetota bacterium]